MDYFKGKYSFFLNSEDLHDPDIPLLCNRAKGGTLIMWEASLDPFVSVHVSDSSAFLPIILQIPNIKTSIHVALYLPTAGQDTEFLAEVAKLRVSLDELLIKFPDSVIYLRGDANSSKTNKFRDLIFSTFCKDYCLKRVQIKHPTYHHFTGQGKFDSELDVLAFSDQNDVNEELNALHCKLEDTRIDSHHDLLISAATIPASEKPTIDKSMNISAPKIPNTRQKIIWSDEGIVLFKQLTSKLLPELRQRWFSGSSTSSTSVLIQSTNFLLALAASETNKSISLATKSDHTPKKVPKAIRKSSNKLARANSKLKEALKSQSPPPAKIFDLQTKVKLFRTEHRQLVRRTRMHNNIKRDKNLDLIRSVGANQLYKNVNKIKSKTAININKLTVGNKVYEGDNVADGFFDSISSLKKLDEAALHSSPSYSSAKEDYENILKVLSRSQSIPAISLDKTRKILKSLKPSVNDYYSITGAHYLHSGEAGVEHLHYLLNLLISDLNNLDLDELSIVWACILYKGHNKDRSSDRSYRTISTCPFVSKALDKYISDLHSKEWNTHTAETQFQRQASSHDLAALTLTEVIQHSVNTLSMPAYVIFLDAKSAFDLVLREFLINNLYHMGIKDQSLLLIDKRLKSRKTICEWNKIHMGPIKDECGVEQGGINSSDLYKVYNNEQLDLAQESEFGVPCGPVTISCVGQADDVALVANDIHALQALLELSLYFCQKYHVSLSHEKTKLQVYSSKSSDMQAFYGKIISPISINSQEIDFSEEADHVGTLRSVNGNLPHLQSRFTAHRKSLFAVLPAGLARAHRGNPASSIRAHQVYCSPVFLSGTTTLVLKKAEVSLLDQHLKNTLQNLQKLLQKTPRCVVYFLGGQLPGEAQLHMRQLSIFGMICCLQDSVLHKLAVFIFTSAKPSSGSWFLHIQDLLLLYCLPQPLELLHSSMSKPRFKSLVKSHVIDYWEHQLRQEASNPDLTSLSFFKPSFMSLLTPHPLWTTSSSNPYEINKAVVQARMLSGRYITDQLSRHWTSNKAGSCLVPGCSTQEVGSLVHLLLHCTALQDPRKKMIQLSLEVAKDTPVLGDLIQDVLYNPDNNQLMQLLLDCSVLPSVITLTQTYGQDLLQPLFYISRNWCYSIHRKRMNLLGLPQYR